MKRYHFADLTQIDNGEFYPRAVSDFSDARALWKICPNRCTLKK